MKFHSATLLVFITAVLALTMPAALSQVRVSNQALPTPYSETASIKGYQPSLLMSEGDAKTLYDLMPTSVFTKHSGCYQRAEHWTHLMSTQFEIKSMKVFLFFTDRYRREFDYKWAFHVAPLIPVRMNDGSIQEMVFDPIFVSPPSWAASSDLKKYDQKPVSIDRWTQYFIFPDSKCPVVETYEDYLNNQELSYCFVMKTPMYLYSPIDFARDESGQSGSRGSSWYNPDLRIRIDWRPGDLENTKKGLKD